MVRNDLKPKVCYDVFMAQYHKIPQNVTTYEGRIVGKFTAKQFIFLAIGAILIFLVVNSPLNNTIKIITSLVLGGISLILGIANYDGRSTDMWISTFLKVAYLPTQRMWQKGNTPPRYLLPSYHPHHQQTTHRKRSMVELSELIDIWKPEQQDKTDYTTAEKETLSRLKNIREQQSNQISETLGITNPNGPKQP